jgi:calpain
MLYTRNPWGT